MTSAAPQISRKHNTITSVCFDHQRRHTRHDKALSRQVWSDSEAFMRTKSGGCALPGTGTVTEISRGRGSFGGGGGRPRPVQLGSTTRTRTVAPAGFEKRAHPPGHR
jgi:hypothetical protein